jgi:HEAT repeat protein
MGRLDDEPVEDGLPAAAPEAPMPGTRGARSEEASRRTADRLDGASEELAIISRTPADEPRSVARLMAELHRPEIERRRALLRSLRDRELDMASAAVAASALRDPEREIRLLALEVLGSAPRLAPVDALAAATEDSEPEVRAGALLLLGKTGNPTVMETIRDRIRAESEDEVIGAGLLGVAQLVEAAGSVGLEGSALDGVAATVSALAPAGQFRFGEAVGAIARAIPEEEVVARLRAPRTEVRMGAAMLALERDTDGTLRSLAELLHDDLTDIRRLAMVALSRLRGDQEVAAGPIVEPGLAPIPDLGAAEDLRAPVEDLTPVVPALLDALEDPKDDVRALARETLARLEGSPARSWLREQLRRASPADIVRLAGHVVQLGADELLPIVAGAAVALPPGRDRDALVATLRDARGLPEVVDSWAADPDAERRADAVRLSSLVHPENIEPTERALADSSATVRLAAIEACGEEVDGQLVEPLLRLVAADSSPVARRRAVLAFRRSPLPRRLGAADVALHSPDRDVRMAATELLTDGTGDEASALARFLRDPDQEVAAAAVRTLSARATGETLVMLWTALGSVEPAVRERMLDVLATFDRTSLARLADHALASPVDSDRTVGLAVLSRLDRDAALPRIIDSLQDPSPDVRVEALVALQARPSTTAVDAVGGRLRDPDVRVRALAAAVLDSTPDDRVIPYLVEAASDADEDVRTAARQAVLSRRSASVARTLIDSLTAPAHRRAASELLADMSEESRELLLTAVGTADEDARRAIGETLAAAEAGDWLIEQLEDRGTQRRRDAVMALGAMGSVASVPALIKRLKDPDAGVRRLVARVLGELGDARAEEPMKRAFVSDPDMDVVAEIEPALRLLAARSGETDQEEGGT